MLQYRLLLYNTNIKSANKPLTFNVRKHEIFLPKFSCTKIARDSLTEL